MSTASAKPPLVRYLKDPSRRFQELRTGAQRYWIACHALSMRLLVGSLPSTRGSFGVPHAGCSRALERFEISPELAPAPGAFRHAVSRLTLRGLGPVLAPGRHTSLGEQGAAARP